MKKHHRHENNCLNCGTTLEGKFCHNCGQENLEIKESFGHMMNHAISDYFHFDHQFFHTLNPLIFKPGFLTNEYMAGRRAQYLHPIKMYIFISLVYFVLLFQSGHEKINQEQTGKSPAQSGKSIDSVNKTIAKDPNLRINQKKAIQEKVTKYGVVTIKDNEDDVNKKSNSSSKIFGSTTDTTFQQYFTDQQKLPENKRDGLIRRLFNKKVITYKQKYGTRAKEVLKEEFNHNIPKMMFLILPLFALILRLSFLNNKKFYVEHLIYSFHLHCFLFLFLAIMMLLQLLVPDSWVIMQWIDLLATLFIVWYVYKSLRVVYQRSWWRTISKMIGMSISYLFAFTVCFCLLLIITAITLT